MRAQQVRRSFAAAVAGVLMVSGAAVGTAGMSAAATPAAPNTTTAVGQQIDAKCHWHQGHWTKHWHKGHWEYRWHSGWYDGHHHWHKGHWSKQWHPGHWEKQWHKGYFSCNR